jgi:hypothetical protein
MATKREQRGILRVLNAGTPVPATTFRSLYSTGTARIDFGDFRTVAHSFFDTANYSNLKK